MKIAAAIEKMTDFYKGNIHDIYHFLKVWAFAKNIGEAEGLDPKTQETLEMAAVVHDIACPLCREKYGNTSGKHQEEESAPLVAEFFKDVPAGELDVERITWLVTHHHTYTNVEGMDYQILLEADFLVNAGESEYSKQAIENFCRKVFRTEAGTHLLKSMFLEEDVTFTAGQPGSFNLYGGQPGDPEVSGCYLMEQGICGYKRQIL